MDKMNRYLLLLCIACSSLAGSACAPKLLKVDVAPPQTAQAGDGAQTLALAGVAEPLIGIPSEVVGAPHVHGMQLLVSQLVRQSALASSIDGPATLSFTELRLEFVQDAKANHAYRFASLDRPDTAPVRIAHGGPHGAPIRGPRRTVHARLEYAVKLTSGDGTIAGQSSGYALSHIALTKRDEKRLAEAVVECAAQMVEQLAAELGSGARP